MNTPEPVGISNGQLVPLRKLAVPVWDAGFINGVIVSEQVRTFRSKPFLLDQHYDRWTRGLSLLGIAAPCDYNTLSSWIEELIYRNAELLPSQAEQGICFFATPGDHEAFLWGADSSVSNDGKVDATAIGLASDMTSARFYAHTYPLDTRAWQQNYRHGVAVTTTTVCDVPSECWPNTVKVRSRLHYYLAQQQAAKLSSGSYPLLLNQHGQVSDSAIGSIVGYKSGHGLLVQPKADRFCSISIDFLLGLANDLGFAVEEFQFTPEDLRELDELFLVSTPWCIFPIREVDGHSIGGDSNKSAEAAGCLAGDSGELVAVSRAPVAQSGAWRERVTVFRQLAAAWGEKVGTSILEV